jgi:hypothetical protein
MFHLNNNMMPSMPDMEHMAPSDVSSTAPGALNKMQHMNMNDMP